MIKNPPLIKKVVEEMGGTVENIIPERGCFYIHLKGKSFLITRKFRISNNLISISGATKFKDLTYTLLKKLSLPTPETIFFFRKNFVEKDFAKLKRLKYPIILKDASGSNSRGIFPDIKTFTQAKKILRHELKNFSALIAQEMVIGKEYRVLILNNKVIGALEMIPPRVFGNGTDSILTLIRKKQAKLKKKTPIDIFLRQILKEQGFSLKTILKQKQFAFIRKNSSLAEGGETSDVTDHVNQNIVNICAKATDAVGDYLAGIDVMCTDITKDPKKQVFSILEINGKPDLYIHYNPTHGQTRNVIRDIINFILLIKNEKV